MSQEGEIVGVLRNDLGILHVFINGADQGPAAFNVPENVYGIVGKLFICFMYCRFLFHRYKNSTITLINICTYKFLKYVQLLIIH